MHPVTLAAYHKAGPCANAVGGRGHVRGCGGCSLVGKKKHQPRINYENYRTRSIQMLQEARRNKYCSLKLNPVP